MRHPGFSTLRLFCASGRDRKSPGRAGLQSFPESKEDCAKVSRRNAAVQKQARLTSKGQITVPRDIRRTLGVRPGDRLLFESDSRGVRIRPLRAKSPFEKYRGIGNPGIPSGRKAVRQWIRELRGQ
jgi:AbrB family looped-hinge helix DNA binding protein